MTERRFKIMKTSEKVAFIKGLMEGLALDASKPETKVLNLMAEVLEELAASNNALIEENIKLKEYVEEIDEDLGTLEEVVYTEDEDDDYYDYDDDDDDWDDFDDDEEWDDDEDDDGDEDGKLPF